MARSASRKMTRKSSKRSASRKMTKKSSKRSASRRTKHQACVSKTAKKMFAKVHPRTAKGRGKVLARAQKHCA